MTIPGEPSTAEPAPNRLKELVLFLLTGGLAALVNLVSRFLLTPYIGFEIAVVVAYLIGMVVAYLLFRSVVFGKSKLTVAEETVRFTLVNIVALAVVTILSIGLARVVFPAINFTWRPEEVAHVIAVCVPAVTSYFGHSRFTFARN